MSKDRVEWIDACRGIAIVLVVIGHSFREEMLNESYICQFIYNFIYSFHMALFMFLSGITYGLKYDKNCSTPLLVIRRKFKSLMIPFLIFTIALYVIFYVANILPGVGNLLAGTGYAKMGVINYIKLCFSGENPYGVHMWFIYCLFIVSVFGVLVSCIDRELIHSDGRKIFLFVAIPVMILRFVIDPSVTIVYRSMYIGMFYFIGVAWKKDLLKKGALYIIFSVVSWMYVIINSCLKIVGGYRRCFKALAMRGNFLFN